jgi:hypothetical protein
MLLHCCIVIPAVGQVFLPWIHLMSGAYMLYVLDQEALNMTILDTTLPPERMKGNIPFKRYVRTIIQMEQDYMLGMKAQGSRWKAIGIFYWKTIKVVGQLSRVM